MPILFPPHPDNKISPHRLGVYEKSGNWIAQRKFNGTHILLHISADRKITILTRHGTAPKLFNLSKCHIDQILSLNFEPNKEYWLNGELLDHKTKNQNYKSKIILFDILQAGEYLIMKMNQQDRLNLLSEICGNPTEIEPNHGIALQATPDIWLAEHWSDEFEKHFEEFNHLDEIEGLILRKKNSFIDNYGQREYSVNWIVRCRKPHAGGSYNF
jgi:ATP-dependent DNA ligase